MNKLDLQGQPLDLQLTLTCGQAFRWTKNENGLWCGVVGDKLIKVFCENGYLHWQTFPESDETLVKRYFRLDEDVNFIYKEISKDDPHLQCLINEFNGMRILTQDTEEALFSFLCSAANSIPRITASINELCIRFGNLVCEHDGVCYYTFPKAQILAELDEHSLRKTGTLAFRGANIKSVANQLLEIEDEWLNSLKKQDFQTARNELIKLKGVGRKIADCICLFSLEKDESVPVDTHVRQIAQRYFLPDDNSKSITDSVYHRVSNAFYLRYGKYAGWAQQFLFYEDVLRTRALGRGVK